MAKVFNCADNSQYVSIANDCSRFALVGGHTVTTFNGTQCINHYVLIEHYSDGSVLKLYYRKFLMKNTDTNHLGAWVVASYTSRHRLYEWAYPSYEMAVKCFAKKVDWKRTHEVNFDPHHNYNLPLVVIDARDLKCYTDMAVDDLPF